MILVVPLYKLLRIHNYEGGSTFYVIYNSLLDGVGISSFMLNNNIGMWYILQTTLIKQS